MSYSRRTIQCSECGRTDKHEARGMCRLCYQRKRRSGKIQTHAAPGKNPEAPCKSCGKVTTAKNGMCRACNEGTSIKDVELTYADTLVGGKWVQRGAIKVWRHWYELTAEDVA